MTSAPRAALLILSALPASMEARAQDLPAQEPREVSVAEATALIGTSTPVKFTGTLLFETGPGRFYLRNDTGRIRGQLEKPILMKPGDRIEVIAVPVRYNQRPNDPESDLPLLPWLHNGRGVNLGPGALPEPVGVQAGEAYASEDQRAKLDGEFVRMQGRVTAFSEFTNSYTAAGVTTVLRMDAVDVEDGGRLVQALFLPEAKAPQRFEAGSLIGFSGTCRLERAIPNDRSGIIQVLVPGVEHAAVLAPPPFWSRAAVQRAMKIAGVAMATILALGAVWAVGKWRKVHLLRRLNSALEARVAERTAQLESARGDLERALASERLLSDLKSNFVSMVSHEFRTPLGIIGSSAQILDRYDARLAEDERREHLGAINASVRRMAGMMEDVLVLSRVDSGRMNFHPAPLVPADFCRRLLDEFASAHGGPVTLETAPEAGAPAHADENLIRHILTNLLANARKYSPPGAPVYLALTRDGSDAVFTIRDEGIGIPTADQPRLFEAFHRGTNVGHVNGTGLGLVIVRRCCEIHGGSVNVCSEEGAGATFTVRLPLWNGSMVDS